MSTKFTQYEGPRSDEWQTPIDLFETLNELYSFTVDLAANTENYLCNKYYTEDNNSLEQDWALDTGWLNPPFSKAREFFEKCEGNEVVAIYKACNLETALWQDVIFPTCDWVCFLRGRTEMDAVDLITRFSDREDFFFYVDPPYYGHGGEYGQKVDYRAMVKALKGVKGKVMVSEYPKARQFFSGWRCVEREYIGRAHVGVHKNKGKVNTECLFMNWET